MDVDLDSSIKSLKETIEEYPTNLISSSMEELIPKVKILLLRKM